MGFKRLGDRCTTWVRAAHSVDETAIAHRFFGRGRRGGVMIDVGAHTGESFAAFATAGWQVHAFEPDPRNHRVIADRWGSAPSVVVNASAVAAVDAADVTFVLSSNTWLSSLGAFDPSHRDTICVRQVALRGYCVRHHLRCVDFLKVDAEGYDLEVLRGFPWETTKPRLVVCEFEDRKRSDGHGFVQLAELLRSQGYRLFVSEWHPIVSYHGPFRWRRFLRYPGRLPDPNGNGNLLAVRTRGDERRLAGICAAKTLTHALAAALRATWARIRNREGTAGSA